MYFHYKQLNFYIFKTVNPSKTYVDDVYVGAFDYIPAAFTSSSGARYDFENYTASDGITPPTKWAFVNGEEGKAFGVSDADSSGNAVKLVSDGTKAFEMEDNVPETVKVNRCQLFRRFMMMRKKEKMYQAVIKSVLSK